MKHAVGPREILILLVIIALPLIALARPRMVRHRDDPRLAG